MPDKTPPRPRVLAVDNDPKTLESLRLVLESDYEVLTASSGEEALETIAQKNIDLVFLDIHMPAGIGGLEVLKRIKDSGETLPVVMVTATNTAKTAVAAMKLGAFDYITKPFDPEEIPVVAQKAFGNSRLEREVISLRSQVTPTSFESIIGESAAIRGVCTLVSKAAPTDASVLIQGETGTGKELVARAIHFNSLRKDKPFLALNCAGIPETLLETELFGFERGAFTGADRSKPGKFELAHEGTLFLDEISSLRLDLQGKILRAIERQEIERVGGTKSIRFDVRILSATNTDLKKMIRDGKFREDLYYRLLVIPILIPPLRERREDIPLLWDHFLKVYQKKFNKNVRAISKNAMDYLISYPWRGNVRELENMVERLVVLSESEVIETRDLPFEVFLKARERVEEAMNRSIILKDARDHFERDLITAVLEKTSWNQTEAARTLGIHRNTLILKKDQLGISKEGQLFD